MMRKRVGSMSGGKINTDTPCITAHRAGALLWAENSPSAHKNIRELVVESRHVDCVECDVHQTLDGAVPVFHDNALERLTETGSGVIEHKDLAYLKSLRLKNTDGEHMITLRELFELHRDTKFDLQVELKTATDGSIYPNLACTVAKLVREFGYEDRVIPISFSPLYLTALREYGFFPAGTQLLLPDGLARLWGVDMIQTVVHKVFVDSGVSPTVGVSLTETSDEFITSLASSGAHDTYGKINMSVWGANDEMLVHRSLALPLVNISTDCPDIALRLRA